MQYFLKINFKIYQFPTVDIKYPTMDRYFTLHERPLHIYSLDYIDALFLYIELHKSVVSCIVIFDSVEFIPVQSIDVPDIA